MEAKDKLQIVLLGTSGSGKSASGNTILGEKVFKSRVSTQSVTLSYQTETRIIEGMDVTVVDTPGWYCTKMPENEVSSALTAAIASLNGPYAFLMVIPIGSFTHKEIDMIKKLRQELGKDFMDHTTILFSYSDNLESKSFEQFLKEEKGELHEFIQRCGNRVYTWNNKNMSSVSNLHKMLKDLRETQRTNDSSEKCRQSQQDQDLSTCDKTDLPDVDMKRYKRDTPEPLDKTNEAVRVIVLGMAGAGKTSTIQTLLGHGSQIKRNTPPVHMTSWSGMCFMLIDSLGFKDMNEVESVISQSLSHASPGPHVILIIIKVGRLTDETSRMINGIHACLDDSVKHTMIVFSRKDDLEDKPIKEFIEESPALKNIVEMHGGRVHALNNKDINDQTQGNELFEKISAIYRHNNTDFIKEPSRQHEEENKKPGILKYCFQKITGHQ